MKVSLRCIEADKFAEKLILHCDPPNLKAKCAVLDEHPEGIIGKPISAVSSRRRTEFLAYR